MPQHSLLPGDPTDVGLRLTIIDHAAELEDAISIGIELRELDKDWFSFGGVYLPGRGTDMLASTVEDLVHAWHYEDRRAILREAQRDQRAARLHNRRFMRQGGQ